MPRVFPGYKEAAKSRIVQAATKVFSEKGYNDSSMDDIAKEVGVTKATLYSYFKSKKDLLKIISISANQALRDVLHTSFKSGDYKEALEEIYNMKSDMLKIFLHADFEMIALSPFDGDIRKIIRDEREKNVKELQIYLQNQIEKGAIRTDADSYILANSIFALYCEMVTQLLAGFDKTKVHETWDKSIDIIMGKC
jgi:AcrR family transcriptional regulator